MIDWIIAQQGILCISLALLIITEHFFTPRLGVMFTYKLWLLVPLLLVANNLPYDVVSIASSSLRRYVVGVNPNIPSNNMDIMFSLWAFGVSVISAYVIAHHWATRRSISKRTAINTNAYYSSKAVTPMLFGYVAPKILIPYSFKTAFSVPQQALVLEHENVHRQHNDHLWNAVALLIAIVFWFNPLVWIAVKSFRINQELACDHNVLKNKTESEKRMYARALVQCAEHCSNAIPLYPTFGEKSTMKKRLNSIKSPLSGNKVMAAVALSVATLVTGNTALANMPTPTVKNASASINEAKPTKRIEPIYPRKAIEGNMEGFVVIEFDITQTGSTDNITIVKSSPQGIFDDNALAAFKQWQYKPAIKNGKAVTQTGLLVQLDFKLSPDSHNAKNDVDNM